MGDYMSVIKANNITNVTGGIPTVKGQKLIPTAWVNFNGESTVAIRDSENVSSITDNGTGDYTVTFATSMANINYASAGFAGAGTSSLRSLSQPYEVFPPTTASCRYNVVYANNSIYDAPTVSVLILGGQA